MPASFVIIKAGICCLKRRENKTKEDKQVKPTIGIDLQDFNKIRTQNIYYIDKSLSIKEWWEAKDDVTLIMRPRRFGKTLTMSMVENFFSIRYAGSSLFKDLQIWKEKNYK